MGEFPRYIVDSAGCDTVFPADLYDVGDKEGGELEYTDDVHSDAGEICLGGEFGDEVGGWWVECVGGCIVLVGCCRGRCLGWGFIMSGGLGRWNARIYKGGSLWLMKRMREKKVWVRKHR